MLNHIQYSGTPEQRANFEKLAAGLENLPEDAAFNMANYRADGSEPWEPHACGTSACALGWAPSFGIAAEELEDWDMYETRVFGTTAAEWSWCFGMFLTKSVNSAFSTFIDDTPKAAARRIRYMLKHGLPEDFWDQVYCNAPYTFTNIEETSK